MYTLAIYISVSSIYVQLGYVQESGSQFGVILLLLPQGDQQ